MTKYDFENFVILNSKIVILNLLPLSNPLALIRKFFPLDKNYLLEEAQLSLQDALLTQLIEQVKSEFELRSNPLGLLDEFSLKIRTHQCQNLKPLYNFYQNIAG